MGEARAAAAGAADHQLKDVTMLPPIPAPEKIICVGINYPDRGAEYKGGAVQAPQKYPNLFLRFPSSLVGDGQPIVRPKVSEQFDYEGEIVLVIGKEGRHIPKDKALSYHRRAHARQRRQRARLAAPRHAQRHPGQELRQLRQPRPLDRAGRRRRSRPSRCGVTTKVNGELRQDDTTDRLTWGFAWLINYISTFATLKPGDLIWTGTPTGAGGHQKPPAWLKPGDVVEVEVPEIGVLRNTVVDEA